MRMWKKALIGGMSALALATGANWVAAAATSSPAAAVVDVKGPCDEAEHANDPQCAGTQVREDNGREQEQGDDRGREQEARGREAEGETEARGHEAENETEDQNDDRRGPNRGPEDGSGHDGSGHDQGDDHGHDD